MNEEPSSKSYAPKRSESPSPAPQVPALSVGRIVLFGFLDPAGQVSERPAIVVRLFGGESHKANLEVFTDGSNDDPLLEAEERSKHPSVAGPPKRADRSVWRTSVGAADDQATPQANRWRWPPRI